MCFKELGALAGANAMPYPGRSPERGIGGDHPQLDSNELPKDAGQQRYAVSFSRSIDTITPEIGAHE